VSAGVVTGKARVILMSDTAEKVLPGEILVAPFTDPGWSVFFITAVGLVVDMGGVLSHGSVVAREYGIPAVVNVKSATKIIKTGQMIRVDGNNGRVDIIK
jgi:pyruvate,water dikinase